MENKKIDVDPARTQKLLRLSLGLKKSKETDNVKVKREITPVEKELHYWGAKDDCIMGTMQSTLKEISNLYDIQRSYVTVEYAERRFVDYLVANYEVKSASYANLADGEYSGYSNLIVQDKNVDAFVLGSNLIIFFDDKKEVEKILGRDESGEKVFFNYSPGSYTLEMSMFGYYLAPIKNSHNTELILDDDVLQKLDTDTEVFFSKREFYLKNDLPHKRGILMYGPPGNGKTTFIKNYALDVDTRERFAVVIDCASHYIDNGTLEFLDKEMKNSEKILIFEDVDSVASHLGKRSAFLNFLDGMTQLDNTLVIATTNYPERLDPALLKRRSRFDKKYKIDLPSQDSRRKFMKKYFDFLEGELLEKYVELTDGFAGADFKELFILSNIQGTTIIDAIEQMQTENMLFKSMRKSGITTPDDGEHDIELFKATDAELKEERITYGIVLKPNDVDAHADVYDGPTVVKAADFYMEHFANAGLMHKLIVNKKIKILQSYTALSGFTFTDMAGNKRKIVKDTWLMKFRVIDDMIWENVKTKKLTGLSIGALATVRELKKIMKMKGGF